MLHDKIEQGELVIMAADRIPIGNSNRVSKAPFLGKEALFPQGPFILAGLLRCPVFTFLCLKRQGKFVIYFDCFSPGIHYAKSSRDKALTNMSNATPATLKATV